MRSLNLQASRICPGGTGSATLRSAYIEDGSIDSNVNIPLRMLLEPGDGSRHRRCIHLDPLARGTSIHSYRLLVIGVQSLAVLGVFKFLSKESRVSCQESAVHHNLLALQKEIACIKVYVQGGRQCCFASLSELRGWGFEECSDAVNTWKISSTSLH